MRKNQNVYFIVYYMICKSLATQILQGFADVPVVGLEPTMCIDVCINALFVCIIQGT